MNIINTVGKIYILFMSVELHSEAEICETVFTVVNGVLREAYLSDK